MVWYEIVVTLLGSLGGLAGITAFIKSFLTIKQDRQSKEINNEHAEIDNLKEFINIANNNYDRLDKQFKEYKKEVDERITFFKLKFDKMEQEKEALEIATMQAYRCKFPPEMMDCPVVKSLKASQHCEGCGQSKTEVADNL